MVKKRFNKGQEELVGFALIVVLVVVVILFFLVYSLRNNSTESVQSYEVDNFVQSALQYTTNCSNYLGNFSVQDLIFQCANHNSCLDERDSCQVLNSTVKGILDSSWKVINGSAVQGYQFQITSNNESLIAFKKGSETKSYKGALQDLAKEAYSVKISMQVYY